MKGAKWPVKRAWLQLFKSALALDVTFLASFTTTRFREALRDACEDGCPRRKTGVRGRLGTGQDR